MIKVSCAGRRGVTVVGAQKKLFFEVLRVLETVKLWGEDIPVIEAVDLTVGTKNSLRRTKIGHMGEIFFNISDLSFIEAGPLR